MHTENPSGIVERTVPDFMIELTVRGVDESVGEDRFAPDFPKIKL